MTGVSLWAELVVSISAVVAASAILGVAAFLWSLNSKVITIEVTLESIEKAILGAGGRLDNHDREYQALNRRVSEHDTRLAVVESRMAGDSSCHP